MKPIYIRPSIGAPCHSIFNDRLSPHLVFKLAPKYGVHVCVESTPCPCVKLLLSISWAWNSKIQFGKIHLYTIIMLDHFQLLLPKLAAFPWFDRPKKYPKHLSFNHRFVRGELSMLVLGKVCKIVGGWSTSPRLPSMDFFRMQEPFHRLFKRTKLCWNQHLPIRP